MRKVPQERYRNLFVRISLFAADLGEEGFTGNRPPKKLLHQIPRRLLTSSGKYQLPKSPPRRRVHEIAAKRRDEIERDDLRPHIAVVPRRVTAGNVIERARKRGT